MVAGWAVVLVLVVGGLRRLLLAVVRGRWCCILAVWLVDC